MSDDLLIYDVCNSKDIKINLDLRSYNTDRYIQCTHWLIMKKVKTKPSDNIYIYISQE